MNRDNTTLLIVLASLPSCIAVMLILRSPQEPAKPVPTVIPAPISVVTPPPSIPPPVRRKPEPHPQQPPVPQAKPFQALVVNVLPAPVIVVTPPSVKSEPKPHSQHPPDTIIKSPQKPSDPPPAWISLFNGKDVSDWAVGRSQWSVSGGVLRNAQGQDPDWIVSNTDLPEEEFTLEMRVKIVDGMRFRVRFNPNFWLGNEGFQRQFEIYGGDLAEVERVSDQTYVTGQWYTLRLVVDAADYVWFYKNDVLTYTGRLQARRPSRVIISAGDGWSAGHIEISLIRLSSKALHPTQEIPAS